MDLIAWNLPGLVTVCDISSPLPLAESLRLLTSTSPQLSSYLPHHQFEPIALLLRLVVCSLFSAEFFRDVAFSSAQGSIVSVKFAELLVFCDHVFGDPAQLFPETQNFLLKAFNIR